MKRAPTANTYKRMELKKFETFMIEATKGDASSSYIETKTKKDD
jgi:hypothetical protein